MGMITRVRGRVRANSVTVDKEKTAQSVCLLSAVLLLPYCPRGPLPLLPSPAPALYSALVLPVVLSANYRYPVYTLKALVGATAGKKKKEKKKKQELFLLSFLSYRKQLFPYALTLEILEESTFSFPLRLVINTNSPSS